MESGSGFRTGEYRTVTWSASTTSNEIQLRPGATFTLDLPSTFVGTTIGIQFQSRLNAAWKDVVDTDGVFPFAVTANKGNVVPASLYLSGLGAIRFKSSATETCEAILEISR